MSENWLFNKSLLLYCPTKEHLDKANLNATVFFKGIKHIINNGYEEK